MIFHNLMCVCMRALEKERSCFKWSFVLEEIITNKQVFVFHFFACSLFYWYLAVGAYEA